MGLLGWLVYLMNLSLQLVLLGVDDFLVLQYGFTLLLKNVLVGDFGVVIADVVAVGVAGGGAYRRLLLLPSSRSVRAVVAGDQLRRLG